MKYSRQVWEQLKNKYPKDFIAALTKDIGPPDEINGAEHIFIFPDKRRVSIHLHSKSYGPKLLKALLTDIGWTEGDMRRLKLIKKR